MPFRLENASHLCRWDALIVLDFKNFFALDMIQFGDILLGIGSIG